MVSYIDKDSTDLIAQLFKDWNETLIWSCLQGCMGVAYADSLECPVSAQIIIADFCFFAGKVNRELIVHKPLNLDQDFIIMVPQNEEWAREIEIVYGEKARQVTRYAFKKEKDIFDVVYLMNIVKNLDIEYELKLIDENLFDLVMAERWSRDLCSHFENYADYEKRGVGVVVQQAGKLLAGASSYTVYRQGIEIEIDTKEEYRRRGLALSCGARLILECIKRGLYPSWDAQNPASMALAEKLGYHFDNAYKAYEITNY